jgi:hypothetical protein
MHYQKRILTALVAGLALLLTSLLTTSAAFPPSPTTSITLGRPQPFTYLQDLEQDAVLNALRVEVEVFCRDMGPGEFSPEAVKQHLCQTHDFVIENENRREYYYVIDEDGIMRRVCTSAIRLSVFEGGQIDPVLVSITQTIDV